MCKTHSPEGKQFDLEEAVAAIRDASVLLNEVYETVDGASEVLDMLYERLQECCSSESVGMASVVHLLRAGLCRSTAMIGEADEALSDIRHAMRNAVRDASGKGAGE